MKTLRLLPYMAGIVILMTFVAVACQDNKGSSATLDTAQADSSMMDTLHVVTLYGPTSYFIYKDEPMGYDYELLMQLARDKNMILDLKVAPDLDSAVRMMDDGKVDLIAFEVPITKEYKGKVLPAGTEQATFQVLVQPKGDSLITDVEQLRNHDIYVEDRSKASRSLAKINEKLGGTVKIHHVTSNDPTAKDLIERVADGEIPLTVMDNDLARMNKTYYDNLDVSMQLTPAERTAWGVSPSKQWLADTINAWSTRNEARQARLDLLHRYFELSKNTFTTPNTEAETRFANSRISPYDDLFKRHADNMNIDIDWDWRLLAAQGHTESGFKPAAKSWAGARGIMQIMPRTAQAHGLSMNKINEPNANIRTATQIISSLNDIFKSRVPDEKERIKFILAAYNAGQGHVLDAMRLAKKYGKDPTKWDGNVADAILMKQKPRYYKDPVVKYGYCRGRETYAYVNKIMDYYTKATSQVPR